MQDNSDTREPNRVTGQEGMRDAIANLCSGARRKIAIYAPSLNPLYLNDRLVIETLTALCTGGPPNQIRLLVEQGDRTIRENPRLIALARRVRDFIHLRELGEDTPATAEMFVLVDRAGYLHQADAEKAQCVIDSEDATRTGAFMNRFNHMWDRSVPIGGLHVLGLGR